MEACVFPMKLTEKIHEKVMQLTLKIFVFAGGTRSFYSCHLQVSEVAS